MSFAMLSQLLDPGGGLGCVEYSRLLSDTDGYQRSFGPHICGPLQDPPHKKNGTLETGCSVELSKRRSRFFDEQGTKRRISGNKSKYPCFVTALRREAIVRAKRALGKDRILLLHQVKQP